MTQTPHDQPSFISKVAAAGAGSFATYSKLKKVLFHRGIVTKSFVSVVNCLYLIILCVYYYNGMTTKPHDHLFQKSWQWGLAVL